ncbi:MAG: hypothetical protein KIS96_08755 [Bauldia sp.]|nr:hypothetical protein [Bauldia sp.]
MLARIRRFYSDHISIGDRLGEAVYAVWMAVVSIGLINSETEITADLVGEVIAIAFAVNIVWGVIDGVTVMLTNIIDRRRREQIVHDLRAGVKNARKRAMEALDETIAGVLSGAAKANIVAAIAAGPAGPDPGRSPARPTRADWLYALGIVLIDTALVVPLVLPLMLIDDIDTAIYVSRMIAVTIFAALGAAYARNLNRRPAIAALLLGGFGYAFFTAVYEAGW